MDENWDPITVGNVVFPRVASQHIRAMGKEQYDQWMADRIKAKTDPLFLGELLDFDFQEEPHRILFSQFPKMQYPAPPLGQLDTVKRLLLLWSRGVFKTSCVIVMIVQIILNYPDVRIVFLTGSDDLAINQLNRVKRMFEVSTDRFKYLFPEYVYRSHQNKKTGKWVDTQPEMGNAHRFTVPARMSVTFAEGTMQISTAKKAKSGSHYDWIFADDLVNDQNFKSEKMLQKVYDDYLSLLPLLDPQGYLILTGTRYNFDDSYERIQVAAKDNPNWKFSIKDCWSSNCMNCGCSAIWHDFDINILEAPCTKPGVICPGFKSDGTVGTIFPVAVTRRGNTIGFTVKFLYDQKLDLGPAAFANQYENKPLSSDLQTFTETMIGAQTIFDKSKLPGDFCYTFAVGDLADTEDDGDESVLYVVKKFAGQLFVVKCYAGKWGPNQTVDTILRLLITDRPAVLYLEKTLGSGALMNQIHARAAEMNLQKTPIEWLRPGNQKGRKHFRISNIQPALVGRRLWIWHAIDGYQTLVDQLTRFPRIKRDDRADCLGWVVEAPTGYELETPPPPPQTVSNWLRKLNQAQPLDDEYTDHGAGSGICC